MVKNSSLVMELTTTDSMALLPWKLPAQYSPHKRGRTNSSKRTGVKLAIGESGLSPAKHDVW